MPTIVVICAAWIDLFLPYLHRESTGAKPRRAPLARHLLLSATSFSITGALLALGHPFLPDTIGQIVMLLLVCRENAVNGLAGILF